MNGEKPKFKPWKELVDETKASIEFTEQQLAIQYAILQEAKDQIASK